MGTSGGQYRNLRVQTRGRLVVFAHGITAPTDEEWDGVLEVLERTGELNEVRTLVHTAGAAPTVLQRGKMNDLLRGRQPRIAVLTPSKLARAAGVALRWFNPRVRVFDAHELDEATLHLEVTPDESATLKAMLASAKAELGLA
jgi:hypothetical protein